MLPAGDVVVDRLLGVARLLEVHGQHRRELTGSLRIERLERLADTTVQLSPLLLEERAVGRVLDEGVPEQVLELGAFRSEADETLGRQRVELGVRGHADTSASPTTRSRTRTGNCRPMTAAIRRLRFAASGSWSIRASSRPWRLSGISTPPA